MPGRTGTGAGALDVSLEFVLQTTGTIVHHPPSTEPVHFTEALQRLLDESLLRDCFVLFSGGVDSTLLLWLLALRARQSGLAPPTPVTYRYSAAPATDERVHQELVISQLGDLVGDWLVLDRTDIDVTGPDAERLIAEIGLPPVATMHSHLELLERIGSLTSPVSLITGDGGDELFGAQRAAVAGFLISRARRRFQPAGVRQVLAKAGWLAFPPSVPQDPRVIRPWLTARALEQIEARSLVPPRRVSWKRGKALEQMIFRGYSMSARACLADLARSRGVVLQMPLTDRSLCHAIVGSAPRRSFTDRPTLVDRLYPGVLPNEILGRRSKAHFDEAFVGAGARSFAERWNGTSISDEFIDREKLRDAWLSDIGKAATVHLLQAAWASEVGLLS